MTGLYRKGYVYTVFFQGEKGGVHLYGYFFDEDSAMEHAGYINGIIVRNPIYHDLRKESNEQ